MVSRVTARVSFAVPGPLEITVDGQRASLPSGKQRTLLATLLLHANGVVSLSFLYRALWDDRHPANPQSALATCMTRLRQRLRGLPGDISQSIETSPAGYEFNVASDDLDLLRFREQMQQSRSAAADGDLITARNALVGALSLWRRPALSDVDSECLHGGILVSLIEEHLLAIERRQILDLLLGHEEEIIGELQILVQENPARERFRYYLVLALYRAGRSGEALEVYQDAITYLREEFGVDPSEEMRALHLAIVQRDPDLVCASQTRAGCREPDGSEISPGKATLQPWVGTRWFLGVVRRERSNPHDVTHARVRGDAGRAARARAAGCARPSGRPRPPRRRRPAGGGRPSRAGAPARARTRKSQRRR